MPVDFRMLEEAACFAALNGQHEIAQAIVSAGNEIISLRARVSYLTEPRPMKTAPRGGRPFMVQRAFDGFFPAGEWGFAKTSGPGMCSVTFNGGFEVMTDSELTGWLPLPGEGAS